MLFLICIQCVGYICYATDRHIIPPLQTCFGLWELRSSQPWNQSFCGEQARGKRKESAHAFSCQAAREAVSVSISLSGGGFLKGGGAKVGVVLPGSSRGGRGRKKKKKNSREKKAKVLWKVVT